MNARFSLSRLALAGGLGLALFACPPPPAVNDGGTDTPDAGCVGQVGCECTGGVGGTCSTGECLNGTCTDCRRGEAACICRANNTCNSGLRCTGGTCQTCPAGEMGCPCGTGDTCNTGLTCASGTCVTDTCMPGANGCPCRGSAPQCDGTDYCDSMTVCQACSNDIIGCPCVSGVCVGNTTCDSTTQRCRAPVTCAQLRQMNMCLPNQECVEMNGMDATCTPATCVAGFKWTGTACVMCVSTNCANEPTCAAGVDGGLAQTCAAQNRICDANNGNAQCGACVAGFTDNGAGMCIRVPTCGTMTCPLTQYCDVSSGTPRCEPLPCPSGQARPQTSNTCTPCSRSCTGPGVSGRIWPFRALDGSCVCETVEGYYFGTGSNADPTACDADGDGWVREEALAVRSDTLALLPNSRCTIKTIDRVRLVDEYNVAIEVRSCDVGLLKVSAAFADGGLVNGSLFGGVGQLPNGNLVPLADGGSPCPNPVPLELVETQYNDIGRLMNAQAPAYGARRLLPEELNSLTKACVSTAADFNDNTIDDIREVQTNPRTANVTANRSRLEQFSYFMELYTSYVEGNALVIKERSRCDGTFPFEYSGAGANQWVTDGDAGAGATPYWRTCSRGRDATYNQTQANPGYDFAQYSCDFPTGGCAIPDPPHAEIVAPTNPLFQLVRKHGLCNLNGGTPADGKWRGMTAHSMFRCVSVVSQLDMNSQFYDTLNTRFGPGNGQLTFNTCTTVSCQGDGGCNVAQGTGAQTRQPIIDCTATTSPNLGVGFALTNFRPDGGYISGCANEDTQWGGYLCPYPTYSFNSTALEANFGRYSCYGRPANFLWCGTPCNETISTLRWGPTTKNTVDPMDGGAVFVRDPGIPVFR